VFDECEFQPGALLKGNVLRSGAIALTVDVKKKGNQYGLGSWGLSHLARTTVGQPRS